MNTKYRTTSALNFNKKVLHPGVTVMKFPHAALLNFMKSPQLKSYKNLTIACSIVGFLFLVFSYKQNNLILYNSQQRINNPMIVINNHMGYISPSDVNTLSSNFWQAISHPDGLESRVIYAHAFYFDNRLKLNGKTRLLSFVSSEDVKQENLQCLIWTERKENRGSYQIVQAPATLRSAKFSPVSFKGERYIPYQLTCDCPVTPKYVSLSYNTPYNRSKQYNVTNLFQVVIPEKPESDPSTTKTIGVCGHGIYGDIQLQDIPYIIQWVELARMFGASEITLYNVSTTSSTPYFDKLLRYYSAKGILHFNDFPPLPPFLDGRACPDRFKCSESLVRHTSGDCLLRNMHKYWYLLYIDLDEIVVPRQFPTYQEFVTEFLKGNETFEQLASIVIRSAFHYYNTPEYGSTSISSEFPVLKYHTRAPHEPFVGDNSPYSKSFINPRVCDVLWQHRCLHQFNNAKMVNAQEIMVHHYRSSCSEKSICNKVNHTKIRDSFLMDKYGKEIKQRTSAVLKVIGWTEKDTQTVADYISSFSKK